MAESMQYEFPVSDSKEQSSGTIIEHTDTGKKNTKQTQLNKKNTQTK